MLQIKQLKAIRLVSEKNTSSSLSRRIRDVADYCRYPFEKLYYRIYSFKRKLARSWAFAVFGWNNYDFDAGYLIDLIVFKLKRLLAGLTDKDAFSVQEEQTIKSLKLAIKVGERLHKDAYTYAYNRHEKKWGHLQVDFEPNENGSGSIMKTRRDNVTDADKEQEKIEILAAFESDDAAQTRDARLFFGIINAHYKAWWD